MIFSISMYALFQRFYKAYIQFEQTENLFHFEQNSLHCIVLIICIPTNTGIRAK